MKIQITDLEPVIKKHFPLLDLEEWGSSYLTGEIGPWSLWFILDGYEVTSSRGKRGLKVRLVEGKDYMLGQVGDFEEGLFGWPAGAGALDQYLVRVKSYVGEQVEQVKGICGLGA